ncbi:MAG: dihydropteroate synthase [Hydrotalea sp.]|nr:dihydropteroate synthase [Hydrotalea sp.]
MHTLNCQGKLITISTPLVMGILNITPDSFYSNSRMQNEEDWIAASLKMVEEGADVLDIGGQSTRPGSNQLSWEEEWNRIKQPLKSIRKNYPKVLISVDTFYSEVAERAIDVGADIINDISAGNMDHQMIARVGKLNVPYVCMHMQGTPSNMQDHPSYNHVTKDVISFFIKKIIACREAGIKDIIIDPGFGFGKTLAHNFQLFAEMKALHILDCPILVGVSRKSMIYKTLGITANDALLGTTAMHAWALQNNITMLRVHDVAPAKEVIRLWQELKKAADVSSSTA